VKSVTNDEMGKLYRSLDKAVSKKDIVLLNKLVKEAIGSDKSKTFKRAVYQYASLYRSEIPDVRELEIELRAEIEKISKS
jgi:hypothetical protein